MELMVKVGDRVVTIEEAMSMGTDLGTSSYGFKFDENSPMWEKDRIYNEYFLKTIEQYADDRLKARGYVFLNDIYDQLCIARTALGQCIGWIFDPENPNANNHVDLNISNERNNTDENVFILDPNVDGYILDRI